MMNEELITLGVMHDDPNGNATFLVAKSFGSRRVTTPTSGKLYDRWVSFLDALYEAEVD